MQTKKKPVEPVSKIYIYPPRVLATLLFQLRFGTVIHRLSDHALQRQETDAGVENHRAAATAATTAQQSAL